MTNRARCRTAEESIRNSSPRRSQQPAQTQGNDARLGTYCERDGEDQNRSPIESQLVKIRRADRGEGLRRAATNKMIIMSRLCLK